MRHVSRTHRVASDWLFDRVNLDNLQTFWRKKVIHAMNRITFSIWWTFWICRCFLAPISFFQIESKAYRVLCRKEGKKPLQRKVVHQWRSPGSEIWWWQRQELFRWCREIIRVTCHRYWGWTRQSSCMHLETNAGSESIPNRTFSRVENGFHSRTK